jgi:hypothetical protein
MNLSGRRQFKKEPLIANRNNAKCGCYNFKIAQVMALLGFHHHHYNAKSGGCSFEIGLVLVILNFHHHHHQRHHNPIPICIIYIYHHEKSGDKYSRCVYINLFAK